MKKTFTLLCLLFALTTSGIAQRQAIKNKKFRLPFLREQAEKRGAILPLPVGLSVNYNHQKMNLRLSSISILPPQGIGAPKPNPLAWNEDQMEVRQSEAIVNNVTIRPDVWIFPFLNVYGILGKVSVKTNVEVKYPAGKIDSKVSPKGGVYGFGFLLATKLGPIWMNGDVNFAWSDLDLLDEANLVQNIFIRTGHRFNVSRNGKVRMNVWTGVSYYKPFNTDNKGAYTLNKITPTKNPRTGETLSVAQRMGAAWNILGKLTKQIAPSWQPTDPKYQQAIGRLRQQYPNPLNEEVEYNIKKDLAHPVSMLVGMFVEYDQKWSLRSEVGFLGDRKMFTLSAGYRFGI